MVTSRRRIRQDANLQRQIERIRGDAASVEELRPPAEPIPEPLSNTRALLRERRGGLGLEVPEAPIAEPFPDEFGPPLSAIPSEEAVRPVDIDLGNGFVLTPDGFVQEPGAKPDPVAVLDRETGQLTQLAGLQRLVSPNLPPSQRPIEEARVQRLLSALQQDIERILEPFATPIQDERRFLGPSGETRPVIPQGFTPESFFKDTIDELFLGGRRVFTSFATGIDVARLAVATQTQIDPELGTAVENIVSFAEIVTEAVELGPDEARKALERFEETQPFATARFSGPAPHRPERIQQTIAKLVANIKSREAREAQFLLRHPDLVPDPKFATSVIDEPSLIFNPRYVIHWIAKSAGYSLQALLGAGAGLLVTGGNPIGAFAGATLALSPVATGDLYQTLIAEGATTEQAANIAVVLGPVVAGLESSVEALGLSKLAPGGLQVLKTGFARELGKNVLAQSVSRFGKGFLAIEAGEIVTELGQNTLENLARKAFNEDIGAFDNWQEVVGQTFVTTLGGATIGGGVSAAVRGAVPTGEQLRRGVGEALADERGAIGGVQPSPEVSARIAELQAELETTGVRAEEARTGELSQTPDAVRIRTELQGLTEQAVPSLPRQIPGEPEAGVQAAAFGVSQVDVRPVGRGEVTQISLDDQLRLQQAREAAQPVRPIDVELNQAFEELVVKQELLKDDPIANFRVKFEVTPAKIDPKKGRKRVFKPVRDVLLTSFLDAGGNFPEAVTVKQARALLGGRTPPVSVLNRQGKVPREVALDEIVRELAGFEQGAELTTDDVVAMIEKAAADKREIAALEERVAFLEAESFEPAKPDLPLPADEPPLPGRKGSGVPPPETHAPATVPPLDPPTSPPPPTIPELPGAPVPARRFPGVLPDLQPIDPLLSEATKPDTARKIANLPGVKALQKHLNPASVANTPWEKMAQVILPVLWDESDNKAMAIMTHLWRIGKAEAVWGKLDEFARIKSGPLAGETIGDIMQSPSRFKSKLAELPAKERNRINDWVKRFQDISESTTNFLIENGRDINLLPIEEGGIFAPRNYWMRQGRNGETIELASVSGRAGGKLPAEFHRTFATEAEAIAEGFRPTVVDEVLFLRMRGAYKSVALDRAVDWLLARTEWRTTGAAEEALMARARARLNARKADQLGAALNRALRGERGVPSQLARAAGRIGFARLPKTKVRPVTIDSIAVSYPVEAQRLQDLIKDIAAGKPTGPAVQQFTADIKRLAASARQEATVAERAAKAAAERARTTNRAQFETSMRDLSQLSNVIFTEPSAREGLDLLRGVLRPGQSDFDAVVESLKKVSDAGRYFTLAGDFSPLGIQMLLLPFTDPVAYARAAEGLVRSFLDKTFIERMVNNNLDLVLRHPNALFPMAGRTEWTEAVAQGGFLSPGPLVPAPQFEKAITTMAKFPFRLARNVAAPLLIPFANAAEGAFTAAGIYHLKALEHLAKTPEQVIQLDEYVNQVRGLTNTARLGVSHRWRAAEGLALLTSRYTRGVLGILHSGAQGAVGQGGLRGRLSIRYLTQGVMGMVAIAIGISLLRGEEPEEVIEHLDPRNPKFMTWDVAGTKLGFGTKLRSILRTIGQAVENPEDLADLSMENPLVRFLRYQSGVLPSNAMDLVTGKDAIGDPTRTDAATFAEKMLLENVTPIWIASVLFDGGTPEQRALRGLAEFGGLRAYPEGRWDEVKRLRLQYAAADFGKPYEALPSADQKELSRSHSDLQKLEEQAFGEFTTRGTVLEQWIDAQITATVQARNDALEKSATALLDGLISKREYDRDRVFIRANYSGARGVIWDANNLDPKALKDMQQSIERNEHPLDKALHEWREHRANLIAKADLPIDWEGVISVQSDAKLRSFSEEEQRYIIDHKDDWILDLPTNAKRIEQLREAGLGDETWFDGYRELGLEGGGRTRPPTGTIPPPAPPSRGRQTAPQQGRSLDNTRTLLEGRRRRQ